jgi:hypothetical protein
MVTKPVKAKRKKTSRGQRTHVRRMKQEARKGPILDNRLRASRKLGHPSCNSLRKLFLVFCKITRVSALKIDSLLGLFHP